MTSDNRDEFSVLFWAVKHDLEEPLEEKGTFSIYNEQMIMFVEKLEQLQSTITQLESDVKVRDGMLAQMASETGNFIKEQAETIKALKEAGTNIRQEAVTQEPFSDDETYSYLEAWDKLMNSLEGK